MECPNARIANDADPEGPALQVQKPLFGLEEHLAVLVGPAPEEEALADLWWLFGVFFVVCFRGLRVEWMEPAVTYV